MIGDEVVVRYEGDWCAESRVAMTATRLSPSSGPPPVEYPEGTEVEVYDKLMGAPYPAYWKATVKVRDCYFVDLLLVLCLIRCELILLFCCLTLLHIIVFAINFGF